MEKITIVNYGVGNLKSISNTLNKLGYQSNISNQKEAILTSDFIILPGVGAFGEAMDKLVEADLIETIYQYVALGKPLLGICVGMQILFDKGLEMGEYKGLGLIPGVADQIETTAKLPQMGWNNIIKQQAVPWTKNIIDEDYVYFVHSYYGKTDNQYVDAYTEYGGVKIPAMIRYNNIYATQFHPEKSGVVGQQILKDLLEVVLG